jgi:hypothetical protein
VRCVTWQERTSATGDSQPAGDYQMTLVINGQSPLSLGKVIIDDC